MNNNIVQMNSDIIRTIQNLLRDSYTYNNGFTVLKELIQNANDAHSTNLKIFFSDGIEKASHPLLKIPAVIIYDDGDFDKGNEEGIAYIASDNKTSDNTKIGRYGLGMKSVFHLCNMFFYAAHFTDQSNSKEISIKAINPWRESDRPEYMFFSDDDVELFKKEIVKIESKIKTKKGFMLWLPIKDNTKDFNISEQDINPDKPFGNLENIKQQISYIVPLLNVVSPQKPCLDCIEYHHKEDSISVRISGKEKNIIETTSKRKIEKSQFCIYKPEITDETKNKFEKLKASNHWSKQNKDTEPEVCFFLIKSKSQDSTKGIAQLRFCVYLPLEDPEIEDEDIDLAENYTFLIHSNFSVDAGRKGPKGYDDDAMLKEIRPYDELYNDVDAQVVWNQLIIQEIFLPSISLFFDHLIQSKFIDTIHCEKLLRIFLNFKIDKLPFKNSDKLITNYGFAKIYKFSNNKVVKEFSAIDIKKNSYIFFPDSVEIYLLEIFDNLEKIDSKLVCNDDENYILPSNCKLIEKTKTDLLGIIFSIKSIVLKEKKYTDFLTKFFKLNSEFIHKNENLWQPIINKTKQLLLEIDFDSLSKNKTPLANLFIQINNCFDYTKKYRICSTGTNKDWSSSALDEKDFFHLWNQESKFLLVPAFIEIPKLTLLLDSLDKSFLIDGEDSPCAVISKDEAIRFTKHYQLLAGLLKNPSDFANIAMDVISKYENLSVFEASPVKEPNNKKYFSLKQLQELSNKNYLYKFDMQYTNSQWILNLKAKFIPYECDYLLTTKLGESLSDKQINIKESTSENIIFALLNSNNNYLDLSYDTNWLNDFLDELLKNYNCSSKQEFDIIKFFLGKCNKNIFNQVLYCFDDACDEVWKKIFSYIESDAIFIDDFENKNVRGFIEDNKEKLNVSILDSKQIIEKLRNFNKNHNLNFFREDKYFQSENVQEKIFKEFSSNEKELFCAIPLHTNSANGELISIDSNTYLNTENISFPTDFKFNSKIINLSENCTLQDKQKELIDKKLDYYTAINILIRQNKETQKDYSEWIFEQINKIKNPSKLIDSDEIGLIPWIPLKKSTNFVSLRDIVSDKLQITNETKDFIIENFGMFSEKNLNISDTNINLLEQKIFSNSNIEFFLKLLADNVGKYSYEVPSFITADEMISVCKLYQKFSEEPIYNLIIKFANEESLNKNIIYDQFYKKVKCQKSISYYFLKEKINFIADNLSATDEKVISKYKVLLTNIITEFGDEFNLADIKYPVKSGKFKNADEIAATNINNIYDDYLITDPVYQIIAENIIKDSVKEFNNTNDDFFELKDDSDIDLIKQIFKPWLENLNQPKLLYLFFYLLKENYKKIALDGNIEQSDLDLLIKDFSYTKVSKDNYWNCNYTKEEAFVSNSPIRGIFRVRILIPKTVSVIVHSLLGKQIILNAKSSKESESIYNEQPYYNLYTNQFILNLARIDGQTKNLDKKLQDLISLVLKNAYFQRDDEEIQKLLRCFTQSDQITIQVAQNYIFEHIDYILKEYGIKNKPFIDLQDQLKQLSAQEAKDNLNEKDQENNQIKKQELKQEFIEKLKEDEIFQEDIHNAVVKKIRDQQYTVSSILFELLQNADDSVNDLVLCKEDVSNRKRIEIQTNETDKKILFSHFGRLINKTYSDHNISEELKNKFGSDLQNMLSLNFSDKQSENDTGKFGLGFKSVYLICLEPVVRSGELNFEIKGALYPSNYIIGKDAKHLEKNETCVELRLLRNVNIDDVLKEFRKHSAIQILFCKQINEIVIDGKSYYKKIIKTVNYTPNTISYINCDKYQFLVFSGNTSEGNYSICFKVNENDIPVSMTDSNIAKIWNLTPLLKGNSESKLSFLINSDFQIDTGRKQLSGDSSSNSILLNLIAKDFSNIIVTDYNKKDSLISQKVFDSILDVLLTTSAINSDIFKEFGKQCLSNIKNATNLIPNGNNQTIKFSSKVKYFAPNKFGFESSDPKIYECLKEIQSIYDYKKLNTCIVLQNVYSCFKDEHLVWEPLERIGDVLSEVCSDKNLTNEMILSFLKIKELFKNSSMQYFNWNPYRLLDNNNSWKSVTSFNFTDSNIYQILPNYDSDVIKFFAENISQAQSRYKEQENTPVSISCNNTEKISFESIYDLWKQGNENWEDSVNNYYCKLYPNKLDHNNLYKELKLPESIQQNTIPKKWCLFMLTAICQSIPNYNHQNCSNKTAIDILDNTEIIDSFCNGDNLNTVYDKFLDSQKGSENTNTGYYENDIRQFEMLLRLYQVRKDFGTFYNLLSNLCNRENPLHEITEFLVTKTDAELNGSMIDLSATDRTFKMGIHMMIRDLLLCNFWKGQDEKQIENLKNFAYMPKSIFKNYLEQDNFTSKEIRLELKRDFNDENFLNCYDLPFLIYKDQLR